MAVIRVLIVEDHALVREGIRALLQRLDGIEVVGEAENGRDGVRLARQQASDVVLMDISMPDLNGLEAAARVVGQGEDAPRVIMLSMHANEEYVLQALRSGASGYLLKGADSAELAMAIKSVHGGGVYLTPSISRAVIDEYLKTGAARPDPLERLTSRQREILQLIAEGHSTREIGERLSVSVKTVESHRAELMERLEIHDVPGLVRFAIKVGLVSPDL